MYWWQWDDDDHHYTGLPGYLEKLEEEERVKSKLEEDLAKLGMGQCDKWCSQPKGHWGLCDPIPEDEPLQFQGTKLAIPILPKAKLKVGLWARISHMWKKLWSR